MNEEGHISRPHNLSVLLDCNKNKYAFTSIEESVKLCNSRGLHLVLNVQIMLCHVNIGMPERLWIVCMSTPRACRWEI